MLRHKKMLSLAAICCFSSLCSTQKPIIKTQLDFSDYTPPRELKKHRDDIVDIAFKNRKDLEAFVFAQEASRYDERVALSGYLPQIQLGAQLGKTSPELLAVTITQAASTAPRTFPGREAINNQGLSISVSQLILNGGGPIIDYKIAQEATKIVAENMKLQQDTIRNSAETAFLNMQRFLLEKTFIDSRDIASKALFEQNSGKNIVGFLNESSWLNATATYVSDQSSIANYAQDTQTALWTLQRQISKDIAPDEISVALEDSTKINLRPLDFYIKKAFQNRPNLKAQEHMIRQAELSEKKYRNSYIPSASLLGQASEVKLGSGSNSQRTVSFFIGLNLGWQFDGLAGVHSARKAEKQTIEYVLQKKDLEFQVQLDVETAYNKLKDNVNLLKTACANFEQAHATLQLKDKQFEVGSISRIDMAQAQLAYDSAKFQLDSAKIDTRISYQNLLFACGYPAIDNRI